MASASAATPLRGARCLLYGSDPNERDFRDMSKVKALDIHPTRPWVATADERGCVAVWNYRRRGLARCFSPHALLERQREFAAGIAAGGDSLGSAGATGGGGGADGRLSARQLSADREIKDVRAVRWYDPQVLWWSARRPAPPPASVRAARDSPNFLIVVADGRVLLVDPVTSECRSIVREALGGKEPTAAEVVSHSLLAIGCADGGIRLWDWVNWRLAKTLRGHRDKDITHLLNAHP
ncbi:unnamed protein product, partial [Phaeothamnion confervicola]